MIVTYPQPPSLPLPSFFSLFQFAVQIALHTFQTQHKRVQGRSEFLRNASGLKVSRAASKKTQNHALRHPQF
jgi:hypothetical protein